MYVALVSCNFDRERLSSPSVRNPTALEKRLNTTLEQLKNFRDLREQCNGGSAVAADFEEEQEEEDREEEEEYSGSNQGQQEEHQAESVNDHVGSDHDDVDDDEILAESQVTDQNGYEGDEQVDAGHSDKEIGGKGDQGENEGDDGQVDLSDYARAKLDADGQK